MSVPVANLLSVGATMMFWSLFRAAEVAVVAALLLTSVYLWSFPPTRTVVLYFILCTPPFPLHTPGVVKGLLS